MSVKKPRNAVPSAPAAPAAPAVPAVQAWSLMPTADAARRVLHERGQLLAARYEQPDAAEPIQFVRFRLGATELYGLAYEYLETVTQFASVTRVPCTPAAIAGVANYRGELLTLLDLKQFFRTQATEQPQQTQQTQQTDVIVVRVGGMAVGLVVDEVQGNDIYAADSLAPAIPSSGVTNMDYVQGIHQGRTTILNIAALLSDAALSVNETVG